MRLEDIDKKIGMPNVDEEWAKFEKEVFGETAKKTSLNAGGKSRWNRAAAIIAITFGLSIVAVASVLVLRKLEMPKKEVRETESAVVKEATIPAVIEEETEPEEFAEVPFTPISETVEKVTEYAKNASKELPKVEFKNPEQKELVELLIDLSSDLEITARASFSNKKENGASLKGVYSVSVCDADLVSPDSLQANAVAELLLCSELRGTIENPNYYFENPDAQKDAELDLLMLTQGWRRYDIDSILNGELPKIEHSIETSQTISGRVEKTLNSNPKNMKLWLLSPATGGLSKYDLKENSHFLVENLDFADGTPFTLQASTQKETTSFVQIYVDEPSFPKIQPLSFGKNAAAVKAGFVEQATKKQRVDDILGAHLLPDVEVVETKVFNRMAAKPDRMLAQGDYWLEHGATMQMVLKRLHISDFGVIFIDEFESDKEDLMNLQPYNIKQIEYFYGHAGVGPYYGHSVATPVLLVFTKPAYKTRNNAKSLSMKNIRPLGYSQPVEFYSPQYPAADKSIYTTPDYRTTLFWSPALHVGTDGKATLKFYNSDTSKRYLVTIEGVSEEGKIISITKKY